MKRPKIEDFKTEYKHGSAESSSIIKQYSKAQDLYINYLEQLELTAVSQQRELFEIIADRLLSELGAELHRVDKKDLIRIISNCD
jgi:hypothetical protein